MPRILFVTEKYCERYGPRNASNYTNSFHNLFETCEAMDFGQEHIWLDELQSDSIDEQLLNLLSEETRRDTSTKDNRITHIFYSYYGCDYSMNPQLATIATIKENYPDIKQIHIWWDASHPCIQQQIKDLAMLTDLQINIDGTDLSDTFFVGCPQSPRLFFKEKQTIPISFVGRTEHYHERCQYLSAISNAGLDINIAGGRTQQNLTPEEYAKIVRRSKINVNFCKTPHGWTQVKGRIWEIFQSESLLLEQKNPLLEKYLTPGIHYVDFNSPEELISKAQYYLNNENERLAIIGNAKKVLEDRHSYTVLWNKVNEL